MEQFEEKVSLAAAVLSCGELCYRHSVYIFFAVCAGARAALDGHVWFGIWRRLSLITGLCGDMVLHFRRCCSVFSGCAH